MELGSIGCLDDLEQGTVWPGEAQPVADVIGEGIDADEEGVGV
jgi:hypothetical protein